MRIFKKIVAFLAALILVDSLFVFLLEPVTFDHFLSIDKKKAAEAEKTVDLVFFGDSRTIRTFNPDRFIENIDGVDMAYNEGVNQQDIKSTYYFMKDYLKSHSLRYAVVNLNYDYFLNTTVNPMMSKGLTLDRMTSLPGAAEYIATCFSPEECLNIIKSYRYRFEAPNIADTLAAKLTKEYWQGIDVREDIHYVSKGYATWDLAYKQGNVGRPVGCGVWSEETVEPESLEYLDKIAQLCREYEVALYFVESPVTISRMYAIEGYTEFEDVIAEKCRELDVPFWNLNLIRKESVSMYDPYFTDTEHLNDIGSDRTSELLAEIMDADMHGEDVEELFYPGFDAMNEDWACVGSCELEVWDVDTESEQIPWEELKKMGIVPKTGQIVLYGTAFAHESITPEYCFSVTSDNGKNYSVIQEYGTLRVCLADKKELPENAEFRIDARPRNAQDIHHSYRTTLD